MKWFLIYILPMVLFILFTHTLEGYSQENQKKFERQSEKQEQKLDLEAKIKSIEIKPDEMKIEVEAKNLTENILFVAINPVGYNGSILSALEVSKDKKSMTILSYLESERICTKPFDSSGINLEKIYPNSSINFYYSLQNSKIRIRPFCGLSSEVDISKIESVSVILGYFAGDVGIDSLFEKKKRFDETELIDIGANKGKRLLELQFTKNFSYNLN